MAEIWKSHAAARGSAGPSRGGALNGDHARQDSAAAHAYAVTRAQAAGAVIATAAAHGFAGATRDPGPLEAAGLRVINPWLST